MGWVKFSVSKMVTGIAGLIIGLILKFPMVLESLPAKYKILGVVFTASQYFIINVVSIILLAGSIIYLAALIVNKFSR